MNSSFLSARASRVALFSLLALGAYTEAQACPCGCVRVPVDNLLDRPAAATSPFTFDVRYDYVDQNRRNNDAHAHFFASLHNSDNAPTRSSAFQYTLPQMCQRLVLLCIFKKFAKMILL